MNVANTKETGGSCYSEARAAIEASDNLAEPSEATPTALRLGRKTRILGTIAVALAGSLMLESCAVVGEMKGWFSHDATPPPVVERPVAPTPPVVQTPRPKPQVRDAIVKPEKTEKPEKPERLASVDPDSLIGMEPSTVEKLLGSPSKITKNNISLVWVYAGAGCAFQIFFYPDVKTSAFHALKYGGTDGNGGPVITSQACIRDILTTKNNAPG